jgi:arsenite methyltransferase
MKASIRHSPMSTENQAILKDRARSMTQTGITAGAASSCSTAVDETPAGRSRANLEGSAMSTAVDPLALREEVKRKYREVAVMPDGEYHFHTGRRLAARLGYPAELVDAMPDIAVESFAGVANPFALRQLRAGERVVDAGSGAGFDAFVAARHVGPQGRVVGIDMLPEMLEKARRSAHAMELANIEFREGTLEQMPVESGWADVVISNGVINLCATSGKPSPRSGAYCALAARSSSPTLPTEGPSPNRQWPM